MLSEQGSEKSQSSGMGSTSIMGAVAASVLGLPRVCVMHRPKSLRLYSQTESETQEVILIRVLPVPESFSKEPVV